MIQTPPKSICVLRLSAIGDTCNLVPTVRALQDAWPESRITWIIGSTEHQLLGGLDGVEFITVDKRAGRAAQRALKRDLRSRRFDILLHMHASLRASLLSRAIRAPRRIGFDRRRARDFQWLFTNERIEARAECHVLEGFLQFADHLNIERGPLRWDIPIAAADAAFAREAVPRPALVISPCSSQRWRNFRNWRAEHYAEVAATARRDHGLDVVLTGGPTALERDYGERITQLAQVPLTNLIGRTRLPQLLALLARATVLVCPDSGPAHMATAVGTPVIGLYATSNRHRTGPYRSQEWVVDRYPDAVAGALGKRATDVRWGYRVRTPYAMDLITVDDVTRKLRALLERTNRSATPAPG